MMRYHLAENFGSVTFMHLTDTESFAEMLEAAQPDCVVFECVERMLQYMPSMIVSALVSLHQEAELP